MTELKRYDLSAMRRGAGKLRKMDNSKSLYNSVIDNIPDYFGRMGIPAGLAELTRQFGLFSRELRESNQLACDLRLAQDTIIERCAQSIQNDWPEAAATLRKHVDGISGEDWGELNRNYSAKCAENERLREALEKYQWVTYNDPDWGASKFCPDCRRDFKHGHHETCGIALALNPPPAVGSIGENDGIAAARKGKTTSSDMEADRKDK